MKMIHIRHGSYRGRLLPGRMRLFCTVQSSCTERPWSCPPESVLFESTVWVPNGKVPLRVLEKVIHRQIVSSLGDHSLGQQLQTKRITIVLLFNGHPIDLSEPINSLKLGDHHKIVVCFVGHNIGQPLKSWGYGMACASSDNDRSKRAPPKFGPIDGIPVGMWWRYRSQASQSNVHLPLVASIHGKHNLGAYSLIFSAHYPEDVDLGDRLFFSGIGARKTASGKRIPDRKLTKNQTLTGLNKALAMNCATSFVPEEPGNAGPNWRDGLPVRVLRNGNDRTKGSKYLPQIGVRYDGIYKVVKYWPETSNNFRIWKFLLQRDDPQPPPWSEKGRYQRRKLGLESPLYPLKWSKAIAGQRQLKTDKKMVAKSRQQTRVPSAVVEFVRLSSITNKSELLKFKHSMKSFEKAVKDCFKCLFCSSYPPDEPIGFKDCYHNFCKRCLLSSTKQNSVNKCSSCTESFSELSAIDQKTLVTSHGSIEEKPFVHGITELLNNK